MNAPIRRAVCFLCGADLTPFDHAIARQAHPAADDCEVRFTDEWGIYVDVEISNETEMPQSLDSLIGPGSFPQIDSDVIELPQYTSVDDALAQFFDLQGIGRLGGASSGRGWTSFSLFQRCPRAWRRRYLDPQVEAPSYLMTEPPSRAIGSLVHTYLALHYEMMIEDSAFRMMQLVPEAVHEYVRIHCNPEFVKEAWRLFTAYRLFWGLETIQPLATEHDLRDPRTGESCRFDLIAFFPDERPGLLPGTYIVEHKTVSRFDWASLEGWQNDGECIGQVALWQRLGLDKRFGPLRGLIVNLIGKQKEPKLHRTVIAPTSWQVDQHLKDLKRWEGLMNLAKSADVFPRARGNCINRWGGCDYWDECVDGNAD